MVKRWEKGDASILKSSIMFCVPLILEENLEGKSDPACADCSDATIPKSLRIRMVRRCKFSTIREDTDENEEGCVEDEEQCGHS